jgi:hypothetical protein
MIVDNRASVMVGSHPDIPLSKLNHQSTYGTNNGAKTMNYGLNNQIELTTIPSLESKPKSESVINIRHSTAPIPQGTTPIQSQTKLPDIHGNVPNQNISKEIIDPKISMKKTNKVDTKQLNLY